MKSGERRQILECGLRPVGAIGAYAPEGREMKSEVGIRNAEGGKLSIVQSVQQAEDKSHFVDNRQPTTDHIH